jgi:hypothetical protein
VSRNSYLERIKNLETIGDWIKKGENFRKCLGRSDTAEGGNGDETNNKSLRQQVTLDST